MNSHVLLMILDGYGIGQPAPYNAVACADTKFLNEFFENNPFALLTASGSAVGLPQGQMGNSEVGHMNMGAGRIVYQDLTYINKSIQDKSFYNNETLLETIQHVKEHGSALHLAGLLSDGGVHSHISHLKAILIMVKQNNIKNVFVHAWTDGRDTSPRSLKKYLEWFDDVVKSVGIGSIATVCGRFYAMDRDNHPDRTQKAYNAMVSAQGEKFSSFSEIIKKSYAQGISDEFIVPFVHKNYRGMSQNDAVICFNFRPDRVRQITRMFAEKHNDNLQPPVKKYCCFTQYDENIKNVCVAFKPRNIKNTLGECIQSSGMRQLRIAETEKYAHVTFFLNGGREAPYSGEDRIIIKSPDVKTYDLKPEMSAYEIADKAAANIALKKYNLIVVNFANPDMVGHTGNFSATVKALKAVDKCAKKLFDAMTTCGGVTIITADHGNADKMADLQGNAFTSHTCAPVPFAVAGCEGRLEPCGALCDVAPTILKILGIKKPCEMTGQSLFLN